LNNKFLLAVSTRNRQIDMGFFQSYLRHLHLSARILHVSSDRVNPTGCESRRKSGGNSVKG
jgi:hypothetical protein